MFFSLPDLTVESCTIRFTSFCMLSKRRMSYPTGMKCSYTYSSTPGFLSSILQYGFLTFILNFLTRFLWEELEKAFHKKKTLLEDFFTPKER